MPVSIKAQLKQQRDEQVAWQKLQETATPPEDAARAQKRREIEARLASLKLEQEVKVGSTATVRGVLGQLNGRRLTVEQYDRDRKIVTGSVSLPSGTDELVELPIANLENLEAPKPPKEPARHVTIVAAAPTDYFHPEFENSRLVSWHGAYRAAFAAEHEWLEKRSQKTSSTSVVATDLPAAELMSNLVFRETQEPLVRECFFAHPMGQMSADACGFATVDVDPHPQKVCHIRMLMVDPGFQRQGIGLALLHRVVEHYATRHLGVKFANHAPQLESFYAHAGFKRIGQDDLFTYMAIKRL